MGTNDLVEVVLAPELCTSNVLGLAASIAQVLKNMPQIPKIPLVLKKMLKAPKLVELSQALLGLPVTDMLELRQALLEVPLSALASGSGVADP